MDNRIFVWIFDYSNEDLIITRATDDQCQKTALFHPKTLFQGEVFHNLFIFLTNTTHFYSLNNSFNYVVKNIHSKNLFIQQKKQIIHSKNLFIQNNPKLFIQRKCSFKWKMDYRPGLLPLDSCWLQLHCIGCSGLISRSAVRPLGKLCMMMWPKHLSPPKNRVTVSTMSSRGSSKGLQAIHIFLDKNGNTFNLRAHALL